jgi:hypothetical protein
MTISHDYLRVQSQTTVTPLTTIVTDPDGNKRKVCALSNYVREGDNAHYYYVSLIAAETELKEDKEIVDTLQCPASMRFEAEYENYYTPTATIYLIKIDNNSQMSRRHFKDACKALVEYAFRASRDLGFGGHIRLQASWTSHVFH